MANTKAKEGTAKRVPVPIPSESRALSPQPYRFDKIISICVATIALYVGQSAHFVNIHVDGHWFSAEVGQR